MSEIVQQWVSVRDRMPSNDRRVLVAFHTRPRAQKPSRVVVLLARYSGGEWRFMEQHVKASAPTHARISHWMRLPEPPSEAGCVTTQASNVGGYVPRRISGAVLPPPRNL